MNHRNVVTFACFLTLVGGCNKDKAASTSTPASPAAESTATTTSNTTEDTSTPSSAPATSTESAFAGRISGVLAIDEGGPSTLIANAMITAEGHPEIEARSAADGSYTVEGVIPGTVVLYALSGEAHLTAAPSSYGIKIPEVVVKSGKTTDLGKKTMAQTGGLTGKVAFFANPNSLSVEGTDVYVPGTSFLAKTDSAGNFNLPGLPAGSYSLRVQHTGYAVTALDQLVVGEGATTDLGEINLSLSTGPEGAIALAATNLVTIDGNSKKASASRTVTVNLTFDSDTALMKIADEPTFLNRDWVAVKKRVNWDFTSDGAKTLYVTFSDLNGLESSPFADSIIVDTEAPVLNSLSLLNGWAQSSQREVFADMVAKDSGTGIAKINFSENPASFPAGNWQTFAPQLDVTLSNSSGFKTVYAKVRDYLDHESVVPIQGNPTADSIQLELTGSTLIPAGSIAGNMVLKKAQSPFLVAAASTFEGNLTIQPGVTLNIAQSQQLSVKGRFTAIGTSASVDRITIAQAVVPGTLCNLTPAFAHLNLKDAPSGVSNDSVAKWVDFRYLDIDVNGGKFIEDNFIATNCTDSNSTEGVISKRGLDSLEISASTFDNWSTALEVRDGNANTHLTDSQGTIRRLLKQASPSTNTEIADNSFTFVDSAVDRPLDIENGNFVSQNNTLLGLTNKTIVRIADGTTPIRVSGLNVNGCSRIVEAYNSTATVTIADSQISGCDYGVQCTGGMNCRPVTFDNSTIGVKNALYKTDSSLDTLMTVSNSTLTCASLTDYCDLLQVEVFMFYSLAKASLTLSDNTINCAAANCRGFYALSPQVAARTATVNLTDLASNTWNGKALNSNLGANFVHWDPSLVAVKTDPQVKFFWFDPNGDGTWMTVNLTATY